MATHPHIREQTNNSVPYRTAPSPDRLLLSFITEFSKTYNQQVPGEKKRG